MDPSFSFFNTEVGGFRGFLLLLFFFRFFFLFTFSGFSFQRFILWSGFRLFFNSLPSSVNFSFSFSGLIISSVFLFILLNNLLGLFPYVWGLTTQVVCNLSMSLVFWLSINLRKVKFNIVSYFSHLTPPGSPLFLVPLLNLIELVRNFIRILTLALRLTIKMMTGHVFICLISISAMFLFLSSSSFFNGRLVFFVKFFYLVFEIAVCFLQAFVFSMLLAQYIEEHSLS